MNLAGYTRVSTDKEEQESSFEAQRDYYTDKIMSNPEWRFVGIFADEGISGTSMKNRDGFNRMIRLCKQGKIDLILTKSIITKGRFLVRPETAIHCCFGPLRFELNHGSAAVPKHQYGL